MTVLPVKSWSVLDGHALDRLRELPEASVQCCVTSPPYFRKRDYDVAGQIGLEKSPEEFVAALVAVFAEVRRVLRPDGVLWLNIGDTYNTRQRGSDNGWDKGRLSNPGGVQKRQRAALLPRPQLANLKPKDLIGVPWMLAFALRADGWWLRSENIWEKPTPLPESVRDRPSAAHEQVFLLTKSARYFYDNEAIREPLRAKTLTTFGTNRERNGGGDLVKADNWARDVPERRPAVDSTGQPLGANKRTVWRVAASPFTPPPGFEDVDHFATFPRKLVETCVLAGSSSQACGECAAPWRRVVERQSYGDWNGRREAYVNKTDQGRNGHAYYEDYVPPKTVGWEPTCEHTTGGAHCIVLDPFAGAGTVGLEALRLDRSFIGIELNPAYAAMARERIRQDAPLLNTPAEVAA